MAYITEVATVVEVMIMTAAVATVVEAMILVVVEVVVVATKAVVVMQILSAKFASNLLTQHGYVISAMILNFCQTPLSLC